MTKKNISGAAGLLFATLIWGTSFVVMKDTLDSVKPLFLLAVRFSIGALVFVAVCAKRLKKIDLGYLKHGALMGIMLALAYILQTYGLNETTPGKNAFLTAVYCVLVPFMNWLFLKKKPGVNNIAAAVVCFIGVGLLSMTPGDGGGVNNGDGLTLAGGALYALHIIVVTRATDEKSDTLLLTLVQFTTAAVICWVGTLAFEGAPQLPIGPAAWKLLYLGLVVTAVALFLQVWGQGRLPPSSAAIILSFEAVFGVTFSLLLGYDEPSVQTFIGFALMFISVILSEARFLYRKRI